MAGLARDDGLCLLGEREPRRARRATTPSTDPGRSRRVCPSGCGGRRPAPRACGLLPCPAGRRGSRSTPVGATWRGRGLRSTRTGQSFDLSAFSKTGKASAGCSSPRASRAGIETPGLELPASLTSRAVVASDGYPTKSEIATAAVSSLPLWASRWEDGLGTGVLSLGDGFQRGRAGTSRTLSFSGSESRSAAFLCFQPAERAGHHGADLRDRDCAGPRRSPSRTSPR